VSALAIDIAALTEQIRKIAETSLSPTLCQRVQALCSDIEVMCEDEDIENGMFVEEFMELQRENEDLRRALDG
jgi:hypothetical protein